MFDERKALQVRLEQLDGAELKILREHQNERDKIYKRLRELDGGKDKLPNLRELAAQENKIALSTREKEIQRNTMSNPVEKRLKQREAAIELLESQPEGVKSVDLKRHVESEVGEEITNMTTFMQTLMNKVPGIVKVSRGFYQYNSKENI
ncbi:hypothetical protein [Bacillus atrophaeus]|uniref:Rok-like winged helix domain-containing protein n=1 Tax=Bacillus atrophaeus TaxID=1452 RepID=UPI00227ED582|nr:hypothetical protein [Bacillus atrophaeus]MCY8478051.1 hypothetical protein [Bacillus atrophaeus]MCY8507901.1 hypothetical protein [Bacillus atrophaeus]MED1017887.1 hypothetical protein [Bacillus atrophaeus]MED1032513.1 hypothetical protein [Bacillus atrophaeus]MED1121041.1 hypothetical protein [Bacillus atrophaeus]